MPDKPHAHTLPMQQTRLINATEGLRLEVLSGCLWLTRPSDSVDRFLVAGASMALHENQVLIQSDRHPDTRKLEAARYALVPLAAPISRASAAMPASDKSSVAKLPWAAPSACLSIERR